MNTPLAQRIRPTHLDEIVGQQHILGKGKALRKIVESGNIPNLIFFGPPGTGKTTLAELIAVKSNKRFVKLNGTSAKTADIKEVLEETNTFSGYNGIVLYLDEIQYLNKKQQQTILEQIETGQITLIAATTENPYFYVYSAVISRSVVFEFLPVSAEEIKKAVCRAFAILEKESQCKLEIVPKAAEIISFSAMGDVRKSINFAELCFAAAEEKDGKRIVTEETAQQVCASASSRYDKDSDMHYDILSAFQKSIRGSDPDAALHYLARLLEAGDLISPCRRLLVVASEDIGLAYPMGIAIVKACVDSAFQLGLPEARIPLAQAVILLCTSPKSNSAIMGIENAMADIRSGHIGDIPMYLKDAHYEGSAKLGRGLTYQYPHNFSNSYVKQQYLPDEIKDRVYYTYGNNKTEQIAKAYWDSIKGSEKPNNKKRG